jgi:hypothetical protein
VAPKGQGLVFDLVAAEGLSPAQAVRFNSTVRQVEETCEQAYSFTDGPRFFDGRAGDLARLYDRGEKWQAEMILAESAQGVGATMENAAPEGSTKPGLLWVASAGGLSLLPPLAFELCVHLIPWAWMRDHTNTLPLQIGGSAILFLGCFALFVPQSPKWLTSALFALGLVLLKLLGGKGPP